MELKQIIGVLSSLTEDELRTLNKATCDMLKAKRHQAAVVMRYELSVNDRVVLDVSKMRGCEEYTGKIGTVREIARTRAQVNFPDVIGRFGQKGVTVGLPLNALSLVN